MRHIGYNHKAPSPWGSRCYEHCPAIDPHSVCEDACVQDSHVGSYVLTRNTFPPHLIKKSLYIWKPSAQTAPMVFFVTIPAAKSLVLRGQLPRFALRFFLPGTFSLCAELLRFQNLRKHFIVNEGNRGRGRTAHLPGSSGKEVNTHR